MDRDFQVEGLARLGLSRITAPSISQQIGSAVGPQHRRCTHDRVQPKANTLRPWSDRELRQAAVPRMVYARHTTRITWVLPAMLLPGRNRWLISDTSG